MFVTLCLFNSSVNPLFSLPPSPALALCLRPREAPNFRDKPLFPRKDMAASENKMSLRRGGLLFADPFGSITSSTVAGGSALGNDADHVPGFLGCR
jgi:hypothetical protein